MIGFARIIKPMLAGIVRYRMSRSAFETVSCNWFSSRAACSAMRGKIAVEIAMPNSPSGVITTSQA